MQMTSSVVEGRLHAKSWWLEGIPPWGGGAPGLRYRICFANRNSHIPTSGIMTGKTSGSDLHDLLHVWENRQCRLDASVVWHGIWQHHIVEFEPNVSIGWGIQGLHSGFNFLSNRHSCRDLWSLCNSCFIYNCSCSVWVEANSDVPTRQKSPIKNNFSSLSRCSPSSSPHQVSVHSFFWMSVYQSELSLWKRVYLFFKKWCSV